MKNSATDVTSTEVDWPGDLIAPGGYKLCLSRYPYRIENDLAISHTLIIGSLWTIRLNLSLAPW